MSPCQKGRAQAKNNASTDKSTCANINVNGWPNVAKIGKKIAVIKQTNQRRKPEKEQ